MVKSESIFSGILKYSISTWINIIVGFGFVVITTRLLTPDIYGQISLFLSATSVLVYTITMGWDGAFIRFYNDPPAHNTVKQLLYKNITILSFLTLGLGGIVTIIAGEKISNWTFNVGGSFLCGLLILQTWSQIILRYLNISYRMSFQAKKYTIQNIILSSITRVSIVLAALYCCNFSLIVTVSTIALFATVFVYFTLQRDDIKPIDSNGTLDLSLSLKSYSSYFKYALFSAPTYIVVNINNYASQQIILSMLGAFTLGIFASTGMFGQILMVLKGGFGTYWSAYVYKNYSTEQDKIIRVHDFIMVVAIFALALLIVCRDFVYIFIGYQFQESKLFFSLLLLYPILTFILETTGKGIEIAKKNQISMLIHVLAVLVNLGACYFFTNIWGIWGAAAANALSALVLFCFLTYFSQKFYKTIASPTKTILGVIMITLISVIPSLISDIWIISAIISVILIFCTILYKKELCTGYNLIKSLIK